MTRWRYQLPGAAVGQAAAVGRCRRRQRAALRRVWHHGQRSGRGPVQSLHVDHTADFAALVKSSYFEARKRTLPVLGPAGSAGLPSADSFARELFDGKSGL